MARAVAIVGGVLILAALTIGFWPQRVNVLGASHPCSAAIFLSIPMDQPPQEPEHTIAAACDEHDRKALGLTFGLGFVGGVGLVSALVSERRRALRPN